MNRRSLMARMVPLSQIVTVASYVLTQKLKGRKKYPLLLMLEDTSLVLSLVITDVTFEKIVEIHKMGTAILLVEQNVSRALSLVQRAYVLESGNVIMHGTSAELANNKQVQAAYLGI